MIETIIIDYLKSKTSAGANVFAEKPKAPPTSFIVIEKVGGGADNHIPRATVAIQSYGASMLDAASLNEEVKAKMADIITRNDVSSCQLNSDYNYTDTSTKQYRYQAIFDIVHY